MSRKKILIFADYFLPGGKAGGALKSISNLVKELGPEFEFYVLTRDRDLGDAAAYSIVNVNQWNKCEDCHVFYASPDFINIKNLKRIVTCQDFDKYYLNSFFSTKFTIIPLLILWISRPSIEKVVLAPRGEFSIGALKLKRFKKFLYLLFFNLTKISKVVHFHASTDLEAVDIQRAIRGIDSQKIIVAPDIVDKTKLISSLARVDDQDCLKIIFLSRISPIKNLEFLLRVLAKVISKVKLDIFGPIEDQAYFLHCQALMTQLPSHVSVNIMGEVQSDSVSAVFGQYDLFAFPTKGENFGHVIVESLLAGTPVLLSEKTPWRPDGSRALTVLPLDVGVWVKAIESFAMIEESDKDKIRLASIQYCNDSPILQDAVIKNKMIFE